MTTPRNHIGVGALVLVLLTVALPPAARAQTAGAASVYFPDAAWQHRSAADAGIDARQLKDAIDFAVAGETKNPRDLKLNHYQTFGREQIGRAHV